MNRTPSVETTTKMTHSLDSLSNQTIAICKKSIVKYFVNPIDKKVVKSNSLRFQ